MRRPRLSIDAVAAAVAITVGYGVVFAAIGIRWFKWSIN
jgi:hypothetical protein